MTSDITVLCGAAATAGLVHTLLGPDHYLPFVAMARARQWSLAKTICITVACGVGHVLSSVAIGLIGITFGVALFKLETIESFRGEVAGWLLVTFGLVYFIWGLRRAIRNKPHAHPHAHADGTIHAHTHVHTSQHVHAHTAPAPHEVPSDKRASLTPWVLFTIFLFGPCEVLIPLVMYPAARGNAWDIVLVTAIFGFVTITTMTTVVVVACQASQTVFVGRYSRYTHAVAGFIVLACGAVIQAGL